MDHPNQLSLSPQLFSYKTKFYNKTFLHLGASAEFFDFIIDMVRGSVIILPTCPTTFENLFELVSNS